MRQRVHVQILGLLLLWSTNGAYSYYQHKAVHSKRSVSRLSCHYSLQSQREEKASRRNIGNEKNARENGDAIATQMYRRSFLGRVVPLTAGVAATFMQTPNALAVAADKEDFSSLLSKIKEARSQLDPIPSLIQEEKWDSVRAILITPPLSDCWAKTAKPLLLKYAEQIGELPDGDELAALEYKEEALDHLRFLDMAVYNNVFNPIKTEGETGASKELIKSYYEDPKREYEVWT